MHSMIYVCNIKFFSLKVVKIHKIYMHSMILKMQNINKKFLNMMSSLEQIYFNKIKIKFISITAIFHIPESE